MIYLASPYSHPDSATREQRFVAACRAAAMLIRSGQAVFSPVVHSHPLVAFGLPTDWLFWERCDRQFLERCDEIALLTLPGWETSIGMQAEVRIATELGKPIRYRSSDSASE